MKILISTWIPGLLGLMALFTSCTKNLNENNPSGLTSSTLTNNAAGFETLVNAAYTYDRFWYGKEEGISFSEMGTDIWTSAASDDYPELASYYNLQGAYNTDLLPLWDNFYAAINLCNTGITNIAKVTDYTAAQKAIREGELRFLRAFYYWHIVETWGGVNFTTQPTIGAVTTANRTPVDTFYVHIISDLKFAVANLPATSTDYGRATIPVAKAFLARIYLTRGMYTEASALAIDVIQNYGYSLLPNFADLWDIKNEKNSEVIWSIVYSSNFALNDRYTDIYPFGHYRGSNLSNLYYLMRYDQVNTNILITSLAYGRSFSRYMPTLSLLNLFDETNDSRYSGSFQTVWYANIAAGSVKVGDTAIYVSKYIIPVGSQSPNYTTFDRAKIYRPDGVPIQGNYYESLIKFMDPTRPNIQERQSGRDCFVIRLAEMYLIVAEAKFKLGDLNSAAYYINQIRTRAALPGHVAQMQITPAQVNLDFILDERARELCGEQLRWFDLKRTGKLIERVNAMNPVAAQYIQPYHLVRPIPQTVLDAVTNKSEFTQNPGYN